MIGWLRGIVAFRDDPYIILDVSGVGYKVCLARNALLLCEKEKELAVFTYTHVREEALDLYGFATHSDLELFELLLGVSGIGPKTALNVFALGGSSEIQQAIATNNVDFFTSVPRLGRKNAQKIILELKSKVGIGSDFDMALSDVNAHQDVITVLRTFGFSVKEAIAAVRSLPIEATSTEEKIRLALKSLSK